MIRTVKTDGVPTLVSMLSCPTCREEAELVPQQHVGRSYLACASCRFWYPVVDEVIVLLEPARNPHGFTRALSRPCEFPLEVGPRRQVPTKALVYSFYARMNEFGEAFSVKREPVVVDVGCSTGSLGGWLDDSQVYVGFDLSFESLRFARRASGGLFVQADAERLPLRTGAVPFLVSREVLEHLNDPAAGARELCRVARRGVVVLPTLDFPFAYDPLTWVLVRRGRRLRFGIYGYDHQQLFDVDGWRKLLVDAGLQLRSERPIGTGLALNASDVFWHALFSWRTFEGLPRNGTPIAISRLLSRVHRALHRLDSPLLSSRAASTAFEFSADA
jgi:SAM-dependent methyltransferase